MDKKIIFTGRNMNWLIFKGRLEYYTINSGRITQGVKTEQLLSNRLLLKEIIQNGFDSYEKNFEGREKNLWDNGMVTYNRQNKKFYIPISENFIEFYQLNWTSDNWNKEYITLSNTHLSQDNIDSFYEFSILVEIEGIRIGDVDNFGDKICFSFPNDNQEVKNKMIELFGEPQVHPQNMDDKYGQFAKNYFFIDRTRMDKIIGIKKYRDTSTIGQPDGEQFTGKQEEIILDLHNFDENIYKVFKEHQMIDLES